MTDVSAVPGLAALGWDDGWMSALAELDDPTLVPARVSRVDRGLCTVMTGTAEVRAGFERGMEPAVGDWVGVDPNPAAGGRARIAAVLPRRCVFRRETDRRGGAPQVVAANIDTVFLCDALDGSLGLRHLERFLALAWQSGATPVVLVTKSDTAGPHVVQQAVGAVRAAAEGVSVVVLSSMTGEGLADLAPYLRPGRTVALLGLSGAGKSTLANLLSGADTLATGAVRADGSGRHTTTRRELVPLPGGGLLIDTPGMRALSVQSASDGVEAAFQDIEVLVRLCRYPRCSHAGEQGCELTVAVADGRLDRDRLDSWLRLKSELASSAPEAARQGVAERKRRKAAKVADRRASPDRSPVSPEGASHPVGDTGRMDRPMHPELESLGFLIGTWSGEGRGDYPTISPFGYRETVTFSHVGKPFISYTQGTVATDDGRPLHAETGYLRSPRPGWVELVVAHPTGVVEVGEGTFTHSSVRLRSTVVAGTGSAKDVTAIERDFDFEPGVIRYSLRMAAVGQVLTHHLEGRLELQV